MLILYLHIEKTNYLEDRAVIFSDLMSRSITKDYYNDGTPINKKAKLISLQIKEYLIYYQVNKDITGIDSYNQFLYIKKDLTSICS